MRALGVLVVGRRLARCDESRARTSSSCAADVERRSISSQAESGIEFTDSPPPMRPTESVVRGDAGSGSAASLRRGAGRGVHRVRRRRTRPTSGRPGPRTKREIAASRARGG